VKYIIAGSRTIPNSIESRKKFFNLIDSLNLNNIDLILSGMANGADTLGEYYALANSIDVEYHPANWNEYGKSAGYRRNVEMANNADALILIWDGKSKGSGHMKRIAQEKGLTIYEFVV
jgi:hypothetical protein